MTVTETIGETGRTPARERSAPWGRRRPGIAAATALLVCCSALPRLDAQTPHHDRGPGDLLPPALAAAGAAGAVAVPGGPEILGDDLTLPVYFEAFHRDALLPPTAVPALPAALVERAATALFAATRSRDEELRWQSLWALARLGRNDGALALRVRTRVLGDRLTEGEGPEAEVALVALGLAARGDAAALKTLTSTATDVAGDARKRAFAFYGLGLCAQESEDPVVQFGVLAAVQRALAPPRTSPPEVLVAALHALALTRIDAAPALPAPALELLERVFTEDAPAGPIDFRAHVPIAVAAVLDRDAEAAEAWRARLQTAIADAKERPAVQRSCMLALGRLGQPWEDATSPGAARGEWLREIAASHRDNQVRNFAWIAMGLCGGAQHREHLREGVRGMFLVRPWAALGLAAAAVGTGDGTTVDLVAVKTVDAALAKTRDPAGKRALQWALRVLRDRAPRSRVQDFFDRYETLPPGAGADPAADVATMVATLADETSGVEARRLAALALGHFVDASPRHWSTQLARAIDYRSATPVLLALPNGVLRLP